MELNINDDRFLESPSAETVTSELRKLPEEEFAILSSDDEVYVQVFNSEDGGFQLEYRAGSADEHYGTDIDSTTLEDVIGAFNAFLAGGDDWHTKWNWERVDVDEWTEEDE